MNVKCQLTCRCIVTLMLQLMFSGYIVGAYYLVKSGGDIYPGRVSYILEVELNLHLMFVLFVLVMFKLVGFMNKIK